MINSVKLVDDSYRSWRKPYRISSFNSNLYLIEIWQKIIRWWLVGKEKRRRESGLFTSEMTSQHLNRLPPLSLILYFHFHLDWRLRFPKNGVRQPRAIVLSPVLNPNSNIKLKDEDFERVNWRLCSIQLRPRTFSNVLWRMVSSPMIHRAINTGTARTTLLNWRCAATDWPSTTLTPRCSARTATTSTTSNAETVPSSVN